MSDREQTTPRSVAEDALPPEASPGESSSSPQVSPAAASEPVVVATQVSFASGLTSAQEELSPRLFVQPHGMSPASPSPVAKAVKSPVSPTSSQHTPWAESVSRLSAPTSPASKAKVLSREEREAAETGEILSSPKLRTAREAETLLRLPDGSHVTANEPFFVECRLSTAARSELARPPLCMAGCGADKRYKRAAFLVAIDVGILRDRDNGAVDARKAARVKLLAKDCLCAPRVDISELSSKYEKVELKLNPRQDDREVALVFLQVVIEATIDKTVWTPVGELLPVRVATGITTPP